MKLKVGMKVRIRPLSWFLRRYKKTDFGQLLSAYLGNTPGIVSDMKEVMGEVGLITDIYSSGNVRVECKGDYWSYAPSWLTPAKETKAQRARRLKQEAREAKVAKLNAERDRIAKEKAEAERAKQFAAFSDAGKRVQAVLDSDQSALGCQRPFVVKLLAALTGDAIQEKK